MDEPRRRGRPAYATTAHAGPTNARRFLPGSTIVPVRYPGAPRTSIRSQRGGLHRDVGILSRRTLHPLGARVSRRFSRMRLAMPTVLREGPYRFFFVASDRSEPPHIHVRRERRVAKFWLNPLALQRTGGFAPKELNLIAGVVEAHRDLFLESWYEFFTP